MKVKVLKSTEPGYWYSDKIGEVFDVIDLHEECLSSHDLRFKVKDENLYCGHYINQKDCIFILTYEEKSMKRSDLKTGMKVVTREGLEYIVLRNVKSTYTDKFTEYYTDDELLFVAPEHGSYSWWSGKNLTDDLFNDHTWDIMEVLVPNHPYDVFYHHEGFTSIWKRDTQTPEQKQLQEVMDKISDLQKQAEILQGMIGKTSK